MDTRTKSRIGKLDSIKQTKMVDAFILTSASSVKYFSNYFFYFEYGVSPFQLLPAILLVMPGQDAALILADNEMGQADAVDPAIAVEPYTSYSYQQPLSFTKSCMDTVGAFFQKNKIKQLRIGIEYNTLPFVIFQAIKERYPFVEWVDVTAKIALLKSIKDSDEIELIRKAAHLADIGQATVLQFAKEGMTELELFNVVRNQIETSVGHRVPLMADLSAGVGTASGGGMPGNNIIRKGDLVLSDFTPCLDGYWGDSCNTIVIGKPTAAQSKAFAMVEEALHTGINAMKPGVVAKEIDRVMRNHIGSYPHHGGHGIGTVYHEAPRITLDNETELVPSMVIALEPAIYEKEYGIRLEHIMLITATGSEILTKFEHRFEQ